MSGNRIDTTQSEIVLILRRLGFGVALLSPLGHGYPDLLVSSPDGRRLVLAEIKTRQGVLKPSQKAWHAAWPGPVHIWRSIEDALATFGLEVVGADC